MVVGDTRYDAIKIRVNSRPARPDEKALAIIKKYAVSFQKKIFLGGSTYKTSENMLIEFVSRQTGLLLILAPHHIDSQRLQTIEKKLHMAGLKFIRYEKILQNKKIEPNTAAILGR